MNKSQIVILIFAEWYKSKTHDELREQLLLALANRSQTINDWDHVVPESIAKALVKNIIAAWDKVPMSHLVYVIDEILKKIL